MKARKIVSILLLLALVCVNSKSIKAEEISNEELTYIKATDTATPAAYTVCGDYTSHYMVTKGTGYVAGTKGYLITFGACFQCKRCNLVFICEGDPLNVNGYDNTIGHYITQKVSEPISNYGAMIDTSYSSISQLSYCSSGKLSGYSFHLQ